MTPMRHSVSDDRLLAYAAGALSSPEALVAVSYTHLRAHET